MENEREQLRKLLKSRSLMFGEFTLASGKKSNFYFDSKLTTLLPDGAWLTAREVLRLIRENGIRADAIGGGTLGAAPSGFSVGPPAPRAGAGPRALRLPHEASGHRNRRGS